MISDPVKDISNADYGEWDDREAFIAAAALPAAIGVTNAKDPGK
jgi:hypothetical protein